MRGAGRFSSVTTHAALRQTCKDDSTETAQFTDILPILCENVQRVWGVAFSPLGGIVPGESRKGFTSHAV